MATQTIEIVRDDYTGIEVDPAKAKTDVPIVLGSEAWVMDMSHETWVKIREMLEPFVANARRVKPPSRRQVPGQRSPAPIDREQNRAIRNWLMENWEALGMDAPSVKGRIPAAAVQAFQRHGGRRVETGPPAKKRASRRR